MNMGTIRSIGNAFRCLGVVYVGIISFWFTLDGLIHKGYQYGLLTGDAYGGLTPKEVLWSITLLIVMLTQAHTTALAVKVLSSRLKNSWIGYQ